MIKKVKRLSTISNLKRKNKKGGKRKRKPETVGGSVSNNSISGLLQAQDQEVTKNSSKGSSNKENVASRGAAATAKGRYIRFALICRRSFSFFYNFDLVFHNVLFWFASLVLTLKQQLAP